MDKKSKAVTKVNTQLKKQVTALIDSRQYFIDKVLPILKDKQDFFVIKGKKSLAKGGAEKLTTIFGLTAKFEMDKEMMEVLVEQKGLIAFKCTLEDAEGTFKGEGRGADTVARNQNDPNKAIKMAQKRAYIDAVIRTTGLSDIFTQDLEDMGFKQPLNNNNSAPKVEVKPKKPAPDPKKAKIVALCNKLGIEDKTKTGYSFFVQDKTGIELLPANYDDIIDALGTAKEFENVVDGEVVEEMPKKDEMFPEKKDEGPVAKRMREGMKKDKK